MNEITNILKKQYIKDYNDNKVLIFTLGYTLESFLNECFKKDRSVLITKLLKSIHKQKEEKWNRKYNEKNRNK